MFLNLKKCLDYLKQYSRIDTKYLWCTQEIFKGDSDVIWGLMNTIYNSFYSKSTCMFSNEASESSTTSLTTEGTPIHSTQSTQRRLRRANESELNSRSKSPIERTIKNRAHSQLHTSVMQYRTSTPSTIKNLNKSLCTSTNSCSKNESTQEYTTPNKDARDNEKVTRIWLRSLNLTTTRAQEDESLLNNPFRNGTLLCEVYLISYHS